MAKIKNSFQTKGSLSLEEGLVYETKKVGKEEIIVPINLFDYLKSFDGKVVSISIVEDIEIGIDDEDYENEE